MQNELRKNEDQLQQMLKKMAKFEMKSADLQLKNQSHEIEANALNLKIQNLEKDLKNERLDRERDKENYLVLYERF